MTKIVASDYKQAMFHIPTANSASIGPLTDYIIARVSLVEISATPTQRKNKKKIIQMFNFLPS